MNPEIAQIITSIISLLTAFLVYKARGDIKQVHNTFNSKMDRLLASVESSALARGKLEGRAELLAENSAAIAAAQVQKEKS